MPVHSESWENLRWSPWIPLSGDINAYQVIPKTAGIYRIRAKGLEPLVYIGQTGRDLRERVRALRKGVLNDEMPFNDPHTAAPNLWVWKHENGYQYECSVTTLVLDTPTRQAMEDMLLWRHRVETGRSTLCNYGRFHPNWSKSKNRSTGYRGERLASTLNNAAGGLSTLPLKSLSNPHCIDWMGLVWSVPAPLTKSEVISCTNKPGVYRIMNKKLTEVFYIGESKNLCYRLTTHIRANWPEETPLFSFSTLIGMEESHRRHEIEVDLIGAFYSITKSAPICQYKKY